VLVSDVPGNRALVEDGVTGLTFSDDRELAAGAQRLAQDGAAPPPGQAGRALVEREYPVSRELDGYLDVYRRLGIAVASTELVHVSVPPRPDGCLFASQCSRLERPNGGVRRRWRNDRRGSGLAVSCARAWKPRPP
jgi:hypothetical protein